MTPDKVSKFRDGLAAIGAVDPFGDAKMKEIQRYEPTLEMVDGTDDEWHAVMVESENGIWFRDTDLAPYVEQKAKEAVDAERKRLREQEVKPLMDAIDRWREACKSIRPEVQSRAEHGIEMAYAAVRAAQEKTT